MTNRWRKLNVCGKLSVYVVMASFLAVLIVGLTSGHNPMVADEVVHYYMLVTQAGKLPAPNVDVNIPMEGWVYHRYYPQPFLWHYVGAILWKSFGGAFAAVQVYQSLYWLQLLLASWFIIKKELPDRQDLWLLCISVLASLPMGLLFSVLFFQGVPATAQVVTAFMLLRRKKLWWSVLFMALALNMKVTAFILLPIYLLGIPVVFWRSSGAARSFLLTTAAAILLVLSCVPIAVSLKKMEFDYYPLTTVAKYMHAVGLDFRKTSVEQAASAELPKAEGQAVYQRPEICNHPGDLRIPVNWGIYFGGPFWLLIIGGAAMLLIPGRRDALQGWWWTVAAGVCGIALTAFHLRATPDARFFMPAIPFLIVGATCAVSRLKKIRYLVFLFLFGAVLQSGAVLHKTASLRHIPKGVQAAIDYMNEPGNATGAFMMYPEGHERFIPGSVVWYMDFRLRDFWRYGNDRRIAMLKEYGVRHIIVKKARIKDVDPDTIDLGLYPSSFVRDIESDDRFDKVFDNNSVSIFSVDLEADEADRQMTNGTESSE